MQDIRGLRFGRLTVLEVYRRDDVKDKHITWLCRCDCGKEIVTRGTVLRSGRQTSCGCLRADPGWRRTVWKKNYDNIVKKRRKKATNSMESESTVRFD